MNKNNDEGKALKSIEAALAKLRRIILDDVEYAERLRRILSAVQSNAETLDDVKPQHYAAVLIALRAELRERGAALKLKLSDVMQHWVWVVGPKSFVRLSDQLMWDKAQFDSKYNYLTTTASLSNALFKSPGTLRKLDSIVFRPGRETFDRDDFNLWKPSRIEPKQGDTTIWAEHMAYLFPDPADRERVWSWLSWVYRNQSEKPNYALLIVGKMTGTGKSFIARVMEQLLGPHNTQRPKNSSLKGDFNGWAMRCQLCIIEELMQIGRREVANAMHELITEKTIEVNEKHIKACKIENHSAVIAISNHPNALPLGENDRRWIVVNANDKRQSAEYYDRLFQILPDDNCTAVERARSDELLAAIAYDLQTRDIGDYNPKNQVDNKSEARAEMIELAVPPLLRWLREQNKVGNYPFNLKLINIREDILEMLPPSLLKQMSNGSDAEAVVRIFIRDELDGGNFDGEPHRLEQGRSGKRGTLWGINGGAEEYAKTGVGKRGRVYMDARAAKRNEFPDDINDKDETDAPSSISPVDGAEYVDDSDFV